MERSLTIVLGICVLIVLAHSGPTKQRLGDKEFKQKDLSDAQHYEDEEHDDQYDHEAFLGEDQSREFDQLPPDESKRRLEILVRDKIDRDRDGFVTKDELKDWIKHVSRKYIYDDADSQWPNYDTDNDNFISWEEWFKFTYGHMEDDNRLQEVYDNRRGLKYQDMVDRDKHRFNSADQDNDGKLSRDEFAIFLHPEDTPYMREVVILETLQDMDDDKDGAVSLEEYISDLWKPEGEDEQEPEWLAQEKTHFAEHRDKNKDGKLDKEELGEWILPTGYDYIEAESNHLIHEADNDKDMKLSYDEILEHHDLFAGSQATEYGEALFRHDEF